MTDKFEFFSMKVPISDDLEGWYKSLLHGKVAIIPRVVFAHRIHFENGVVKVDADKLIEDLVLYEIISEYAICQGIERKKIDRWKKLNIIRQISSFISWADSLHSRGIYNQEQFYKLLYDFSKGLKSKYNINFFSHNKNLIKLQLKFLKMFI